jgi:hypothetical protein
VKRIWKFLVLLVVVSATCNVGQHAFAQNLVESDIVTTGGDGTHGPLSHGNANVNLISGTYTKEQLFKQTTKCMDKMASNFIRQIFYKQKQLTIKREDDSFGYPDHSINNGNKFIESAVTYKTWPLNESQVDENGSKNIRFNFYISSGSEPIPGTLYVTLENANIFHQFDGQNISNFIQYSLGDARMPYYTFKEVATEVHLVDGALPTEETGYTNLTVQSPTMGIAMVETDAKNPGCTEVEINLDEFKQCLMSIDPKGK